MAEKDAHPLNFHTCIVRMRLGVCCLINKMGLSAQLGVLVELQRWLVSLLGWNNTLVTATQGRVVMNNGRLAQTFQDHRLCVSTTGFKYFPRLNP